MKNRGTEKCIQEGLSSSKGEELVGLTWMFLSCKGRKKFTKWVKEDRVIKGRGVSSPLRQGGTKAKNAQEGEGRVTQTEFFNENHTTAKCGGDSECPNSGKGGRER